MEKVNQQYYNLESAVSTQPQGNSVVVSRKNSLITIQQQNSLPIGGHNSKNNNQNQNQTTNISALNQGIVVSHKKQSSVTSNPSIVKNQYVINVTHDSSLMTVADMNNQRKSLQVLTNQQSQLKELFRNKAQTPTHVSSVSHQFNSPYLKDNYFFKNSDSHQNQTNILSRSKINQNKFISFNDSVIKRRQSHSTLGTQNQYDMIEENLSNTKNQSNSNSNSNMFIKANELYKQNQSNSNLHNSKNDEKSISREQIRRQKLQKSYIECIKQTDILKESDYQFEMFKPLIHNFMVNDALIQNKELPLPFSEKDDDNQIRQQQTSIGDHLLTGESSRHIKSKSFQAQSNEIIKGVSNPPSISIIDDQQFNAFLNQEHKFGSKHHKTSSNSKNFQETSYIGSSRDVPKVQFKTDRSETSPSKNHDEKSKIVINIINSKTEINSPYIATSSKTIHSGQNQYNQENEEFKNPQEVRQKEDILLLLMDFLVKIEKPYQDGINCKYYPQQAFLQSFMKNLMEMSNKICHYLMQRKEKVICMFINQILKMISQIFEKQLTYIKEEVRKKVDLEVKEANDKFDFYVDKKAELEDKIDKMYKESEQMQQEFLKKILNMEEIKNQYLEQAEILKERIEESRTRKYKDYQLERIQLQSKEVIKNCAMIEAEINKRKETSKESIQYLAKLTAEHFSTIKNDPRRKSILGNLTLNQSDMVLSNQSENQQSFSEINQITYALKYDKPENKAAILFSHPFSFYIQQDIQNYMYDKLVHKQSRSEMIKMLENFMEEVTILKYNGGKICAATNFIQQKIYIVFDKQKWILQKHSNFFVASIKITEIAFLIQNLVNGRKEMGIFFAVIFGIIQDNMLTDVQFEYMISVRKQFKLSINLFDRINDLSESEINKVIDDHIYIPTKQVLDVFSSVFKNHPQYFKLEEKLQLFLNARKVQINQKAIHEQRKIVNSAFGESSLTLIPNLMEKMKTENINDVIRSLENIFNKLDVKRQDKVNYLSFKKLMINHYGIDTENDSFQEYFTPFIYEEWFNYQGFIQRVIKLHVPDSVNDKLITYYSVLNEICNLLLHNQNQSFHDFRNRLSNYLFNMDSLNIYQFNTIDEFFKSYENSKDDHIKYNSRRISPALLYQYLFRQNDFPQMYQYYKQIGKVDDNNDEIIKKIYPQRVMLDNFNDFLEYNRQIYSFLQVQEKISIIQQSMPSETSITQSLTKIKSKTNLKRQTTVSKLKSLKGSKFQQQNSNISNKSSPTQKQNKKSQFQTSPSEFISQGTNYFGKQDSIVFDRQDSKDSVISLVTPASVGKKSIFSGI